MRKAEIENEGTGGSARMQGKSAGQRAGQKAGQIPGQRGQVYLVAMIFLSGMVISLMVFTGAQLGTKESPRQHLMNNAKTELFNAYLTGLSTRDLNAPLFGISAELRNKALDEGQKISLCFAAWDQNSNYVLGNFSGIDSNYSSTQIPASSHRLPGNSTLLVPRQNLINDLNVLICGKQFDLSQSFQAAITIKRGNDSVSWSNLP